MKYGNRKINGMIPLLILIVSAGISVCAYLLISEVVSQSNSSQTLTKEERKALSGK